MRAELLDAEGMWVKDPSFTAGGFTTLAVLGNKISLV